MPVTITTRGWIELYRDGALVSRHNVESEAIERAVEHAEANGDGDYELRYPSKVVRVSLLQKTVVPFSWAPVAVEFTQGQAMTVDLALFLTNDQGYPIAYGVTGSLPGGVTRNGSVLSYDGAGAVASRSVVLVASSGPFVATSGPASVAVTAAPNLAPIWTGNTSISGLAGSTVPLASLVADPEGQPLTFSLGAQSGGHSVSTAGVFTFGTASGSATVIARDSGGLTASRSFTVTVTVDSGEVVPATYTVSVNGSTVTTRKVSTGQTWNGSTISGSTIGASAGDVIEFASGTYPPLTLSGFVGTAASPCVFRPAAGALCIIRRSAPTSLGFIFVVSGCRYWKIDGYTTNASAKKNCGFRVTYATNATTSNKDKPSAFVKYSDLTRDGTLRYVEVDGGWIQVANPATATDAQLVAGSGPGGEGVALLTNPQQATYNFDTYPGTYVTNLVMEYNYLHNVQGEAIYTGDNFNESPRGLPQKGTVVRYNRIDHCGAAGIHLKMQWGFDSETAECYGNFISMTVLHNDGPGMNGIDVFSGQANVHDNWIEYVGGTKLVPRLRYKPQAIVVNTLVAGPSATTNYAGFGTFPSFTSRVYNNVVLNTGASASSDKKGPALDFTRPTTSVSDCTVYAYNNTIATCTSGGLAFSAYCKGYARNNVIIDTATTAIVIDGTSTATQSNNTISGTLSSVFVDAVNGDYRLAAAQTPTTSPVASTDFAGLTRANQNTPRTPVNRGTVGGSGTTGADRGAYEYT